MNETPYEPTGVRFFDAHSARYMMLISDGPYTGWLAYRHPDKQWVTTRKASVEDMDAIAKVLAGLRPYGLYVATGPRR